MGDTWKGSLALSILPRKSIPGKNWRLKTLWLNSGYSSATKHYTVVEFEQIAIVTIRYLVQTIVK